MVTRNLDKERMANQAEAAELYSLLESPDLKLQKEIKDLIIENLNSTREAWLLNGLVDYYIATNSEQARDILAGVREPHGKHLFEKLNECMKGTNRLLTLTLLGHVVRKQPSWIHNIINQPILGTVIKCMKNDTDVPVLMTAVLVLTSLLPVVPVNIAPYLNEVFAAFGRLAAFICRKPGNVPDVYLLHLNVGVYALFHRLYGMYPCNFLAFLRNHYGRFENREVYEEAIKPMLERVRIHPLLVIGTKEHETSRARWKQFETHDIEIECARMSLDLIEGIREHGRCPVLSLGQSTMNLSTDAQYRDVSTPRMVSSSASSTSMVKPQSTPSADMYAVSTTPEQSVLANSVPCDADVGYTFWSPAIACGLSTPPPSTSHNLTPSSSVLEMSANITESTTPGITPLDTPRESPPLGDDSLRWSFGKSSKGHDGKRKGLNLPKVLSNKTPTPSTDSAVPPSPMKKDFTNQPPSSAQALKAQRLLSFDDSSGHSQKRPLKESKSLSETQVGSRACKSGLLNKSSSDRIHTGSSSPDVRKAESSPQTPQNMSASSGVDIHTVGQKVKEESSIESLPKNFAKAMSSDIKSLDLAQLTEEKSKKSNELVAVSSESSLSVRSLPMVIESLSSDATQESEDQEVCDINKLDFSDNTHSLNVSQTNLQSLPESTEMTAESVAQFMKKVNRIRFNSMTISVPSGKRDKNGRHQTYTRSSSCPNFGDADDMGISLPSDKSVPRKTASEERDNGRESTDPSVVYATMTTAVTTNITVPVTVKSQYATSGSNYTSNNVPLCASQSDNSRLRLPFGSGYQSGTQSSNTSFANETSDIHLPYEFLFPKALPFTPLMQCPTCRERAYVALDDQAMVEQKGGPSITPPSVLGSETPLFTTLSPPEILDRHIQLGGDTHAKTLSKIPLTSQEAVNWTHFGGVPPADEINILRGQNILLHNQLMYERHKREMHAQRNRRLLGKIVRLSVLEEQNAAMGDSLKLQEEEIQKLTMMLKIQEEKSRQQLETHQSDEYEKLQQLKYLTQENEHLKYSNKELKSLLVTQRQENDKLQLDIQHLKDRLFETTQELQVSQEQAAMTQELQQQVHHLNKELLLMGELQKKYQERMSAMQKKNQLTPQKQYLIESYKAEISALKPTFDQTQAEFEAAKTQLTEYEENIKNKDVMLAEQKRVLEKVKSMHKDQLKGLEERYQIMKKINQRQESHILELCEQVERLNKPQRQSRDIGTRSPGMASSDSPGTSAASPGVGPDHMARLHGRGLDTPPGSQSKSLGEEKSAFSRYNPYVSTSKMQGSLECGVSRQSGATGQYVPQSSTPENTVAQTSDSRKELCSPDLAFDGSKTQSESGSRRSSRSGSNLMDSGFG